MLVKNEEYVSSKYAHVAIKRLKKLYIQCDVFVNKCVIKLEKSIEIHSQELFLIFKTSLIHENKWYFYIQKQFNLTTGK